MPARRKAATARVAVEAQQGLRLHAAGERLSTLRKERERLLARIQKTKRTLEGALASASEARDALLARLSPLATRYEAVSGELRAVFDELLAPGRLSANAAKKVARVRRMLAAQGVLGLTADEPLDPWGQEAEDPSEPGGRGPHADPFGPDPMASEGHAKREVDSAQQHGQAKNRESLRAVFKRLVVAAHPDRASHDAEREQRTATMKQATQAYEAGDLARLLELERAWQLGQALPGAGSDEARCRELELVIRELRTQANELQRDLRGVRRTSAKNTPAEPLDLAIAEATAELEQLEAMRDFTLGFRDGKVTLAAFVVGPEAFKFDEEPEEFDFGAFDFDPLDFDFDFASPVVNVAKGGKASKRSSVKRKRRKG